MKNIALVSTLFMVACASSSIDSNISDSNPEPIICEFYFTHADKCSIKTNHKRLEISINTSLISENEVELTDILVQRDGDIISLPVSPDVSFIRGDRGYILIEDINLDQRPDIAVTTSFGVANLYLDYWVFSDNTEQFRHLGNFPRLEVDREEQTLAATVRVNATTYERKIWRWEGQALVPLTKP